MCLLYMPIRQCVVTVSLRKTKREAHDDAAKKEEPDDDEDMNNPKDEDGESDSEECLDNPQEEADVRDVRYKLEML